ncbi:MAG: histidinol-phosphatase HisJ family protein [candidate division KSB1 bacterium]|nr:histidinol-phosphatase HisJ family protein [candidate division KSB1 bacterium]
MVDYHVHCRLSRHGEGELFEYVEAAIRKQLTEIGFAEHIPIPELDDPTGRMPIEDWAEYVGSLFSAKERYSEITIRFGIEADYLPSHQPYIAAFVRAYPFDYVIGSVHFVSDWDFSNMDFRSRLEEFGAKELYRRYYLLLAEAASGGLYDVIGHFDLPKRLAPEMPAEMVPLRDAALQAVKRCGLALDVNTSGLRKADDIYPAPEILAQAFAMDIPITIGSDAHRPEEVAADFAATIERLKRIGYRSCLGFERRKPYRIPL